MAARVYAAVMNKGGTGKTTLVTNLAGAAAYGSARARVLIIDTDPQANCVLSYGKNISAFPEARLHEVLLGKAAVSDSVTEVFPGIDLITADASMDFFDFDVAVAAQKKTLSLHPFSLLRERAVRPLREKYDLIFIDTPPSLGTPAAMVFAAADWVLVPLQPELFAAKGVAAVRQALLDFREDFGCGAEMGGVVLNMVQAQRSQHSVIIQDVRRYCYDRNIRVFDTAIPRTARLSDAPLFHGLPAAIAGDRRMRELFQELLEEVLCIG